MDFDLTTGLEAAEAFLSRDQFREVTRICQERPAAVLVTLGMAGPIFCEGEAGLAQVMLHAARKADQMARA
jgi:hypothetical protein